MPGAVGATAARGEVIRKIVKVNGKARVSRPKGELRASAAGQARPVRSGSTISGIVGAFIAGGRRLISGYITGV